MDRSLGSHLRVLLGLALLALAGFGTTLNAWFQEDDFVLLRRVEVYGPLGTWTFPPTQFFRPLISLSLWAQQALHGASPLPFRLFNLAFHVGVAFLLYLLVRQLLAATPRAATVALATAALFAVHPSHVEPVAWIAARTDLCASFFGLLSLLLFVRYVGAPSAGGLAGSVAAFGFGLLCKESVVIVPLLTLGYLLIEGRRRNLWGRTSLAYGGVFLAYVLARYSLAGPTLESGLVRSTGLKGAGTTLIQIVRCTVPGLPYGDPVLNNSQAFATAPGRWLLAASVIAFGALAYAGYRQRRSVPEEVRQARRFFLVAFAVSLLPAAGLSVRLFRTQGERFLYLPSAFLLAWIVGVMLGGDPSRRRSLALGVGGAVAFLLLQWQNVSWREGAEVAARLERSITDDVVGRVPPEARAVRFLNAPARVQGSYAAFFALAEIAYGKGLRTRVPEDPTTSLNLLRARHRISAARVGSRLTLTIAPEEGAFVPEDTFGTNTPSEQALRQRGMVSLDAHRAVFDLRAYPRDSALFFWDGVQFRRIAPR
jgi:hypothetical protein